MKVLITSAVAMLGSSNFTKNWERDHNYFIPAAAKPQLHGQLVTRFAQMWADTANYTAFQPGLPRAPTLVSPSNGATAVLAPTVTWTRAAWAVAFDVYLGTSPANLQFAGRVDAPQVEDPPARSFVHATRRTPPERATTGASCRGRSPPTSTRHSSPCRRPGRLQREATVTTPRNLRVIR